VRGASEASVPLIASDGVGRLEDFPQAVEAGADVALAAFVLHYGTFTIGQVKSALESAGMLVR
jgi:imidazole glycerol-phosphate synthase subunit HisF